MLFSQLFAQDKPRSEAFKHSTKANPHSFIKSWYPPYYSLMLGYMLKQKAKENDPFAQHELGIRYLLGLGYKKDTTAAVKWIRRAVAQSLPPASFNYAIMLTNHIGNEWDPFEAYYLFKNAAESGMEEAQLAMAYYYMDNLVVNKNLQEAYRYAKLSADGGNETAKKLLTDLEKQGVKVVNQNASSRTSQKKYYSPNKSLIESNLSFDYFETEEDSLETKEEINKYLGILSKDKKKLKRLMGFNYSDSLDLGADTSSIGLVNTAAHNGSPEAFLLLARMHEKGIKVEKNEIIAVMYYLRALKHGSGKAFENLNNYMNDSLFYSIVKSEIDDGNTDAMYVWAGMAGIGFDYQIDPQQAFDLLIKAGEKNHIPSLIETGICYSSGTFVKQDSVKAIEYFEKAASLQSTEAKVRLALFHILKNIRTNLQYHLNVLQDAADHGSVLAQAGIGYCYEKGIGVKLNKGKASEYYRRAAGRGNRTAYQSLIDLYDEVRPNDAIFQIYTFDD